MAPTPAASSPPPGRPRIGRRSTRAEPQWRGWHRRNRRGNSAARSAACRQSDRDLPAFTRIKPSFGRVNMHSIQASRFIVVARWLAAFAVLVAHAGNLFISQSDIMTAPHGPGAYAWWFLTGFPHFFFNDTATTEIYTLSLHDALPICHSHF